MANKGTSETDPEYASIMNILKTYQQVALSQSAAQKSITDDPKPIDDSIPFSAEERNALKFQMFSYKLLSVNKPLPDVLQKVLFDTLNATGEDVSVAQQIIETAYSQAEPSSDLNRPLFGKGSNPWNLVPKQVDYAGRQQRLLVPSIMPIGLDPVALAQARDRYIESRIAYRIQELESLPSNLTNTTNLDSGTSSIKLKALIELKALRLRDKQRKLREEVLRTHSKATTLNTAVDRGVYRRFKKHSMRDARQTEQTEKAQRAERERREKQKHLDFTNSIVEHGLKLVAFHRQQKAASNKLGAYITRYHANAEKLEQQRQTKAQQDRLKTLKEDKEDVYLELVAKAKNTRIRHLISQTNSYLDSLSNALTAQKASIAGGDIIEVPAADAAGSSAAAPSGYRDEYYVSAHKISESIKEQPSLMVGGKLKDYQIKGLQWMVSLYNNRLNGILADEMGLGKTIQTISLVTYLVEKKKQPGPFLVIVPLSTLTNWTMEFEKWAPSIQKIIYKGGPAARKELASQIRAQNYSVCITTYEFIVRDKAVLSKVKWVYCIIDEGHRMKNAESKLSTTLVQAYSCRYRLILTGTPLQNNLPELWALLNFILPKVFNSVRSFDEWFNTPFSATTGGQEKIELNEEEQLLIIKRLHKVLRPFLLRRLKKDVESELPDKVETVIKVSMSALQRRLYEQVRAQRTVNADLSRVGFKALNNIIMQCRKICNHPFVFQEVEDIVNPSGALNEVLYRVAGKFELLDRILPKFRRTGHRVLMFFQMTQIMDIMQDYMRFRGYNFLRLDGTTKSDERSDMLKQFNAPDSEIFIFLLSTRAGGLGLNLQTADTVIIFDSDWNPHQDLQAQDRAHRIGQTKEVRILRLITSRSVEEKILERAQYKLDLDGKVIQAGKFDNKTSQEERDKLLEDLFGAPEKEDGEVEKEAVDDDQHESGELGDDELNEILARNDTEKKIFKQMDKDRKQQEETRYGRNAPSRLMEESELPAVYLVDIEADTRERANAPVEATGRGARARNNVKYDDGLTEEQWTMAVDSGELTEVMERRARREARGVRRSSAPIGTGSEAGSVTDESDDDDETIDRDRGSSVGTREQSATPVPGSRKRGRPAKSKLSQVVADSNSPSSASPTPRSEEKRPRGRPRKNPKYEEEGPRRKRQRRDEDSDPNIPAWRRRTIQQACLAVLDGLESIDVADEEDEEGNPILRKRIDIFLELPDRNDYPDYYSLIADPIAFDIIRSRVESLGYGSFASFKSDVLLVFENARTYNQEGSVVYIDAMELDRVAQALFNHVAPLGEPQVTKDEEGEANLEFMRSGNAPAGTPRQGDDDGPSGLKLKLKMGPGPAQQSPQQHNPDPDVDMDDVYQE
ncbi:hypothetical protein SmJEL517_g01611 [Synchytrium microbalum]|uniref:Uncharacterized protein n=1 Tax=Synchytrium microbalum TaxID=1806994 RepID=A0A507C3N7_9FUNG|nr:uncharacterized protein SmJEL517_g01611 [Synchytrium microbalum]TPX36140.1 hypothetical protein SmJEL517_g01611 [Synchytrium microbalum]